MADCVENMNIVPGAQANGLGRYCCPNQPCCPSMIAGPTGPTGPMGPTGPAGHVGPMGPTAASIYPQKPGNH